METQVDNHPGEEVLYGKSAQEGLVWVRKGLEGVKKGAG